MSGYTKKPPVDFIGIGAPKAGTTWLARVMEAHPDVCLSVVKETNFFCKKHRPTRGTYLMYNGNNIDRYSIFYRKCRPEQIKGEFSVHYMWEESTARDIHEHYPDVKIIAVLRDPATRLLSHYRFMRHTLVNEERPLEDLLHADERLVQTGMYGKLLGRYFELFPRKNIKVLVYEEMSADPYGALKDVYSFLGVDDSFVPHELMKKRINPTAGVRFGPIMKWANKIQFVMIWLGIEGLVSGTMKQRISRLIQRINYKKIERHEVSDETKEKMSQLYIEDRKKLEKLLNRDFSGVWGV